MPLPTIGSKSISFRRFSFHGGAYIKIPMNPASMKSTAISVRDMNVISAMTAKMIHIRMWIIFAVIALITFISRTEIAVLFILAGFIGILIYAPPWKEKRRKLMLLLPMVGSGIASSSSLIRLAGFFMKAGGVHVWE